MGTPAEGISAAHASPTGEAILPAMASGMIWACAGLGAMLAMDGLGFGVGYMLCTNGAILVNGAWSVGYYREISGRRDLALFGGAFVLNLAASAIIAEHRSLCLVTSALGALISIAGYLIITVRSAHTSSQACSKSKYFLFYFSINEILYLP